MTNTAVLDDLTAGAIRNAVAAAQVGRLAEAIGIGERALADGGDPAALNAMLGTFHSQNGNLAAGIRHFQAARDIRPSDPIIALNLATALSQEGDHEAALDVVTEDVAKADPTMRLQRARAFLAQELERFDVATAAYEAVLAAAPDDWE